MLCVKICIGRSLCAREQGVLFRCILAFVSTTMVVVRSGCWASSSVGINMRREDS